MKKEQTGKKLQLSSETLRLLSEPQLEAVAGGASAKCTGGTVHSDCMCTTYVSC